MLALTLLLLLPAGACASGGGVRKPVLQPLALGKPALAPPLDRDLFRKDHAGSIGEADLQLVLDAPVVLEDGARVGVVPVRSGYGPDSQLPLDVAPAALAEAMEATGYFDGVTEVSTDWPNHGDLPGLRELAARYRSEYLLLYRHRYEEDSYANPWAWCFLTVLGGFVAPVTTLESAGVLEASLFDVRTGTILFTSSPSSNGAGSRARRRTASSSASPSSPASRFASSSRSVRCRATASMNPSRRSQGRRLASASGLLFIGRRPAAGGPATLSSGA